MKVLSVFRYGFFFHAISDIRLQYLGPLSVLYSNGLGRYLSPWHCPWPRYLPSRICLRPRLVLVLQTPLLRGSTTVLRSEGQVRHWRGRSNGPRNNLFVLRATARQTLAHYLIGSRIVLDLHYCCVTGVPLRRSGREVEVRHLFSSTLVGCKRDQSAVNVPCRSVTSGVHHVLFTMLNPSSAFPRVLLGTAEEGSKYGTFPSYSERRRSCLTRPAVLCSPTCVP